MLGWEKLILSGLDRIAGCRTSCRERPWRGCTPELSPSPAERESLTHLMPENSQTQCRDCGDSIHRGCARVSATDARASLPQPGRRGNPRAETPSGIPVPRGSASDQASQEADTEVRGRLHLWVLPERHVRRIVYTFGCLRVRVLRRSAGLILMLYVDPLSIKRSKISSQDFTFIPIPLHACVLPVNI